MKMNAVILAAGKGTRMKSEKNKVIHEVLGKPMIKHVVDNLTKANIERKIIIVGEGAEAVRSVFNEEMEFVFQEEQLGTGHAVLMARDLLKDSEGITVVICGDTPLITPNTIENLINYHVSKNSDATILSANHEEPTGYGRIVRDLNQSILKIVEQKDASVEELSIKEINTGTYCFNNRLLFEALDKITNNNAQNEYYITDVIEIIKNNKGTVEAYLSDHLEETIGINTRLQLAEANEVLKKRINQQLMIDGVTIVDPNNTYISIDTEIGQDTIIYPGCIIYGKNKIGNNCLIGPHSHLQNTEIGNHVLILQSVLSDCKVGDETKVGPFAHFRNNTVIGEQVRIGNFVEIKNSTMGNNSNAAHLSYIGDAQIGNNVNMGCGSITVNYDGQKKSKTLIGNNVFVGCNSNLIAPINIDDNSYVAAGSTLTKDVPKDTLAIAREKQVNKEGYAKKYKK